MAKPTIRNYDEQVYAGVLGKVIGVYMGRPFEGWSKEALEKRWGRVDRYVHEDQNVPLVVSDDDISGTLTFVRALEDSGLYADTPEAFFGQTWLNYLIEKQTVLWWGGMGHSTEHTAYLRLKHGVPAPRSGSIALNGKTVAEQIGAQIFIDAFGLVAPGRPELAAKLARRSASVSHDGEAVHAAVVVAGMISAAFVEKDMDRLLDIGVGLIPKQSLIAKLHRDVRAWARKDRDWRKTYDRIFAQYGYNTYGGNCHVVPNHAVMVLAWVYAPDDFHGAQMIVNTAGWDTDCNAANVGSLMGVKVGLARINEKYDFQSPFGDRILLPTADGSRAATDVLLEAQHIARIGRRIMGWTEPAAPKSGAWHHFEMPQAQHGWLSENDKFAARGNATLTNVEGHSATGKRSLRVAFTAGPGRLARVATPIFARHDHKDPNWGYFVTGTPKLYPGQTVTVEAATGDLSGPAEARLYVRRFDSESWFPGPVTYGPATNLRAGKSLKLSLTVPAEATMWPAESLGIEITAAEPATGDLFLDRVSFAGTPDLIVPAALPCRPGGMNILGWIAHLDVIRGKFSDDKEELTHFGKNEGRGVFVTGTTDWHDYTLEARVKIHLADLGGLMVRYQGLERYLALVKTRDSLQLIRRYYGDTVLAEVKCHWDIDELHALKLECKGQTLTAWCDGRKLLTAKDDKLTCGGAGLLFDTGIIGFRDLRIH